MFCFTKKREKENAERPVVPTFSALVAPVKAEIDSYVASLIALCLEELRKNSQRLLWGRHVYVAIPKEITSLSHSQLVVTPTLLAFEEAGWPCCRSASDQLAIGPCKRDQIPSLDSIIGPVRQAKINEHVALILAMVEGHKYILAQNGNLTFHAKQSWSFEYTRAACEKLLNAGWKIEFNQLEITIRV